MKKIFFLTAVALLCAFDATAGCGNPVSDELVTTLKRQAPGLREEVLRLALESSNCGATRGLVRRRDLITIIDYSMPSTEPRLFTFNLRTQKLLFRELVAHGKNSGGLLTKFFSNDPGSLATSLGLFVTEDTYMGSNGYSLRLRGLEPGVNDRARERAIVMHGAKYVNAYIAKALGRLGRSWGCPAVRAEVAPKLINTIRGGTPLFAYYPQKSWLVSSRFLR